MRQLIKQDEYSLARSLAETTLDSASKMGITSPLKDKLQLSLDTPVGAHGPEFMPGASKSLMTLRIQQQTTELLSQLTERKNKINRGY